MDAILTGVVLPGVDNHSLAALVSALRRVGAEAQVVPFQGFHGIERVVDAIVRRRPRVCGISLQTSEAGLASMSLARLLRERGFRGLIVCGGHFATLNAHAILAENPAVDVVVRFAGEEALSALVRGASSDDEIARLPGVVFRARSGAIVTGAPARVRSADPLAAALDDSAPSVHLGMRAADLILSHGCEASCAYCCIASATKLAGREQRRAGASVAPYARAAVDAIADRIAALYHDQQVHVFNVMDDNVLPLDPQQATAWADRLRGSLRARGVGEVALSMQIRADALTQQSTSALVELGLARAYVGIDGYSPPQLRALGRRARAAAGPHALELLWDSGVFAVANSLLVGPTIAFESVLAEIEALSRVRCAPVHLLPIEARPGTPHFERAERQGLLEGGFLLQHYRFVDRRTELLARVVTSLPTRLAERSVPIALYDLGYNLGIARRLWPHADGSRLTVEYAGITAAWNRDQIRLLQAAAVAAATLDETRVQALIDAELEGVTAYDRALVQACDDALRELEALVSNLRALRVRAHSRGQLLGVLALSMSLAGCSDQRSSDMPRGASGSGTGAAAAGANVPVMDAGRAGDPSGGSTAMPPRSDAAPAADAAVPSCDQAPRALEGFELDCCWPAPNTALRVTFDSAGKPIAFSATDGGTISSEIEGCLRQFVGEYCYPSLAGTTQEFRSHCWIA